MLLRAVHFFLQSREVGELEIALSFPFLQMSWNRRSWKYLTGDLPRPAAFQGRTDALYRRPFFGGVFSSLDPGSDYLGGVVPKDGLESGFLAGSL